MAKEFSNQYIFLYISGLVVMIALLLTMVTLGLRPRLEANRATEKAQQILSAAGYDLATIPDAVAKLNDVAEPFSDVDGQEMCHIRCADGTAGVVVSVQGKGLWGPIWGYVVLDAACETIKGVVFSHKSETPGLGAKITEEKFTSSFVGKKIMNEKREYVSVRVMKPNQGEVAPANRVDAISGATLTSKGVDEMLYQGLATIRQPQNKQASTPKN